MLLKKCSQFLFKLCSRQSRERSIVWRFWWSKMQILLSQILTVALSVMSLTKVWISHLSHACCKKFTLGCPQETINAWRWFECSEQKRRNSLWHIYTSFLQYWKKLLFLSILGSLYGRWRSFAISRFQGLWYFNFEQSWRNSW